MTKKDIGDDPAQRVQKGLQELLEKPPTKRLTRYEVVRRNEPVIEKLRQRGHGWDVIAETMGNHGTAISEHTLRQYFQSVRSTRKPEVAEANDKPSTDLDGERLRAEVHAGGVPTPPGVGERMDTRGDASAGFDPASSPERLEDSEDVLKKGTGAQDEEILFTRVREAIAGGASMALIIRKLLAGGTPQVPTEMLKKAAEHELGQQKAKEWLNKPG